MYFTIAIGFQVFEWCEWIIVVNPTLVNGKKLKLSSAYRNVNYFNCGGSVQEVFCNKLFLNFLKRIENTSIF